ncbi:SixA phosphatase family protein [Runella slithyformis]|nr:histidine phosphatase family protein [Runella slithyformis]
MKRYLYIVRHAKAEDSSSFFGDFDRELTSSGTIDAARMGKFLADKGLKPDLLISSSAARAFQTARIIAEQLHYEYDAITTTRDLYDNGPKAYLAAVTTAPDKCHHLMVFGHNPDITYFAEYLTNHDIGSMSKGSVVIVEFDNLDWREVSSRTGKFISYDAPKQFRN